MKIFVAGPSDVEEEKVIVVNQIERYNNILKSQISSRLDVFKYQEDLIPSFGEDAQQLTNDRLLSECDLLIIIMHSKFGSETARQPSGTYEEFDLFFQKLNKGYSVDIMIYFKNEGVSTDTDIKQLELVQKFKKEVNSKGGAYHEFTNTETFKKTFEEHILNKILSNEKSISVDSKNDLTKTILTDKLNEALTTYVGQPDIWVDPIIYLHNEFDRDPSADIDNSINIDSILDEDKVIINSLPQFGATCLARKIALESFRKGFLYLYLDIQEIGKKRLDNFIKSQLRVLKLDKDSSIDGLLVDNYFPENNEHADIMNDMLRNYTDKKIVIFEKTNSENFFSQQKNTDFDEFKNFYLAGLPKERVRLLVRQYNSVANIANEDEVVEKVTEDLSALNIHRTPLNCLSILKVSEKFFDTHPVNRVRMLELILISLFDLENIPTYSSRPDVKDVEQIVGHFAAILVRRNRSLFTKEEFFGVSRKFCKEQYLTLDIDLVYKIFINNNIFIASHDGTIQFKYMYWLSFFAAKKMNVDENFQKYILTNNKYVTCPEVIEFYSGIDRNKNDILEILLQDLEKSNDQVQNNLGLPDQFAPFERITFEPTSEELEALIEKHEDDVSNSRVPTEIKDRYSDRTYNQLRPYNQSLALNQFLEEYNLGSSVRKAHACSLVLRNSDYSRPELKIKLLNEIFRTWRYMSNIMFIISPIIAEKNVITIHGVKFILSNKFSSSKGVEKLNRIILSIPLNVFHMMKENILSPKMGGLLYAKMLDKDSFQISRYQAALLVIHQLPNDFKDQLKNYLESLKHDSFFINDIVNALKLKYSYGYNNPNQSANLKFLIRAAISKHEFKTKEIKRRYISQIPDRRIPKKNKK